MELVKPSVSSSPSHFQLIYVKQTIGAMIRVYLYWWPPYYSHSKCYFLIANIVGCNYEKDIAAYTVKAATDQRAENGLIIYRLPKNVITQLDLISCWERKTGRTMEKTYISETEMVKLSQCKTLRKLIWSGIWSSWHLIISYWKILEDD